MGNLLHRLLFRHNIGKLALGQFLLVFAVLILDPGPVYDVYSWEVMDPIPPYIDFDDGFWAGTEPLNSTTFGDSDIHRPAFDFRNSNGSVTYVTNVTVTFHRVNHTDANITQVTPTVSPVHFFLRGPYIREEEKDPWVDLDSVNLTPRRYEVWVLRYAAHDGKANYQVIAEDDTPIDVSVPTTPRTRDFAGHDFDLDCYFDIEEAGEYHMRADRSALRSSYYMMVVPERHPTYPLVLALGWLIILEVVVVKGHDFLRRSLTWTHNTRRRRHEFIFPPDVAYFFEMGPEPNWKGGAFFRFPTGTKEFFEWAPMDLEFPPGTAGFFDLEVS